MILLDGMVAAEAATQVSDGDIIAGVVLFLIIYGTISVCVWMVIDFNEGLADVSVVGRAILWPLLLVALIVKTSLQIVTKTIVECVEIVKKALPEPKKDEWLDKYTKDLPDDEEDCWWMDMDDKIKYLESKNKN